MGNVTLLIMLIEKFKFADPINFVQKLKKELSSDKINVEIKYSSGEKNETLWDRY